MTARKPPTGAVAAGVALHETIETLLKYGKADVDFTYYETRALVANPLPPLLPRKPMPPWHETPTGRLAHNPKYDPGVLLHQLYTSFPRLSAYRNHLLSDTETHLLPEPVYCNQVYGRTDGRFCITKNLAELSPSWVYETWCGDRIDQSGWDASQQVPTCITCIARRRG